MKFDIKRLPLAVSITAGILYIIDTVIMLVMPEYALRLASALMHGIRLAQLEAQIHITAGNFVVGLVQVLVYAYVAALIFVYVNNSLERA